MTEFRYSGPEPARARLRAIVANVDLEIARLREHDHEPSGTPNSLSTAWSELVRALALGPEPDMTECPFCARPGMRYATRCWYCWKKLTPPAQ
jgi:hypothetical protein